MLMVYRVIVDRTVVVADQVGLELTVTLVLMERLDAPDAPDLLYALFDDVCHVFWLEHRIY